MSLGGWCLTLTCECGTTEAFRGVVPSLAVEHAERRGWVLDGPVTRPDQSLPGICGTCDS